MNLSKLVAPKGEKTVLMVGERHEEESSGKMLEILHSFNPDVIAIEYSADRLLANKPLNNVLSLLHRNNPSPSSESDINLALIGLMNACNVGLKPMNLTAAYAAHRGIPLYLADWQPTDPSDIGDWFTTLPNWLIDEHGKRHLTQKQLCDKLEETITTLFGSDGMMDAECHIGQKLHYVTCRVECEETRSMIKYDLLCRSHQGIALRNEYQAMVLDSLPGKRILYVGGAAHFRPKSQFREIGHGIPDYLEPLQHLVSGSRHYIDLPALLFEKERASTLEELGTDEFPMKVTETKPIALKWQNLEYFK